MSENLDYVEQENKVNEQVIKWDKYKLLDNLDKDIKRHVAVLLENQRIFNENLITDAIFKRTSIPLVRRVIEKMIGKELVSIQSMIGPQSYVITQENEKKLLNVSSLTRITKILFPEIKHNYNEEGRLIYSEYKGKHYYMALDAEHEMVDDLSTSLAEEFDSEIIKNLLDISEHEECSIKSITNCKAGEKTWLVANKSLIPKLPSMNCKVFESEIMLSDEALIGRKDKDSSGYIFAPYIMFGLLENKRIFIRYAKRLINKTHYKKIKFNDVL